MGLVVFAPLQLADQRGQRLLRRGRVPQPLQLVERPAQVGCADRFEQVVDAVDLEGLERIFVVGGGEDDGAPDPYCSKISNAEPSARWMSMNTTSGAGLASNQETLSVMLSSVQMIFVSGATSASRASRLRTAAFSSSIISAFMTLFRIRVDAAVDGRRTCPYRP